VRGFFLVMKAELIRTFIVIRRYWFRTLTGLIIGYGMLMVLIAGFIYSRPMVQEGLSRLDDPGAATNFVLGFIIGMYAFGVVGMFTQGIQGMATTGVLEQLCLSPYGLTTNFLAQTFIASITSILSSGLMVYLVSWTVGGVLHWDTIPVLVLLGLTFFNLIGFGFMVGGLVLIFKQVGQVAVILRMVLFGLAVFAREEILNNPWPVRLTLHLLPVTDAAICLKYVLIQGQQVDGQFQSIFLHPCFYWLVFNGCLWTFVGLAVFRWMEDYSRTKGTLGTY